MRAAMSLARGTKLGPYEIASAIGAGGMGEVYRARDTRLDRYVAVKILHSDLSCTPELKGRFQREARVLSSLSHPHICSLYDVGSEAGSEFLVMELVEGETLSARLQRGPLPLSAVVKLGVEIADALAKAHRLGVIHRDLKPSNIMLTANGAKLMDFGLAKPNIPAAQAPESQRAAELATATLRNPSTPLSTVGTLIGTIQYMAPEQLEGNEADERSDIFALGLVLYEAVTGRRAFDGKTYLSVASAILHSDPPPLRADSSEIGTPGLEYVIRTCLAKDPMERFQTAHDVKLQLSWLANVASASATPIARNKVSSAALKVASAVILVLLAAVGLLGWEFMRRPEAATIHTTRFTVALPPQQELAVNNTQAVMLSSDGRRLAYVAAENGVPHLYTRRLDRFESVAIPDSEGATFPFFSPNGDWVAFFSQGKIKKAPADGGPPIVICEVPTFFGGTWTPQDTIVAAVPNYGLASVPASGGSLQKITMSTKDIVYPQGPNWLAGGEWVAFTDYMATRRSVMAVKLSSGELRLLLKNAQGASHVPDHLVYYEGGALWGVPFDEKQVAVRGNPTQIESGVNEEVYIAQASISETGTIAYAPGPAGNFSRNLYLVDRKGNERKLDVPAQDYVDSVISPDGKRIACLVRSVNAQQLVVLDIDRDLFTTLSSTGLNSAPNWTSDGKTLVFDRLEGGQRGIYRISADGSAPPQLIRTTVLNSHVTSIAADYAAVTVNDPNTSTDQWLLNMRNPDDMRPFKRTPAWERQGSLSPDGHWLAYVSNESGRSEIYVEPVPGPGGRRQISTDGGEEPRWLRSGREILYRNGTRMMSVPVELQPTFQAGRPIQLFDRKFDRGFGVNGYDVTADGQTFVMTRSEHPAPTEIRVVMGWSAEK
jgi:serine/threonine protein kinase/Tol biopolymer transport system component